MDLLTNDLTGVARPVRHWITRSRIGLYSVAMLALYAVFVAVWAQHTNGFTSITVARPASDFSVFWAASHVMLHGESWQAYDYASFAAIERSLFGNRPEFTLLPWLYPPTFLLVVTPLSLLPLTFAYALTAIGGIVAYAFAAMRVSALGQTTVRRDVGVLALIASPGVFIAVLYGQNALLTAALAALAIWWADRKPLVAGICIGLLAIKPQLAVVFPFVLVATRNWRTFFAAAASACAFTSISTLICGTRTLTMFFANTRFVREAILEHNQHFWQSSPTAFAALRGAGYTLLTAYSVQACVALVVIGSACVVWRATRDVRLRTAALTIATLLANPYVWHYELAWLGLALACLLAIGLRDGWMAGEQEAIVIGWLLPVYELFNGFVHMPQPGAVVLLFLLLAALRRQRVSPGDRV
ncbi:glycosyltransferase family 87 protein [Paraburkholderia dinghuensis]|nr:glycosyltransferase family 87 protein [Paraburkholderia dinghuensis]